MKHDVQRIALAAIIPLFLLFILYTLKILEIGMDWDFTHLGVYPMQKRGVFGIFAHPLVHSGFKHLFANTIPFFFLSWCLFYFYRDIAPYILFATWIGCGLLTFLIGKPGWHIGISGIIYGLAFFLLFSGLLRRHVPLIAISLLVTFLYGGLIWNMLPQFAKATTSWEGHLSGAIAGTICSIAFIKHGPRKKDPFADEEDEPDDEDEVDEDEVDEDEVNEVNKDEVDEVNKDEVDKDEVDKDEVDKGNQAGEEPAEEVDETSETKVCVVQAAPLSLKRLQDQ